MLLTLLKSKLHRATVTNANLHYHGSVSIDKSLMQKAHILPWERVDVYNCDNGERFSTYAIEGEPGEITLNGAAARRVQIGDKVIIATYALMNDQEAKKHQATVVLLDANNQVIP